MRVERQFTSEPLSVSSYLLPISEIVEDILVTLSEKKSSPQATVRAKKFSKLLLPLVVRSHKYRTASLKAILLPKSCCSFTVLQSFQT